MFRKELVLQWGSQTVKLKECTDEVYEMMTARFGRPKGVTGVFADMRKLSELECELDKYLK